MNKQLYLKKANYWLGEENNYNLQSLNSTELIDIMNLIKSIHMI
jgi:hypothetical protein